VGVATKVRLARAAKACCVSGIVLDDPAWWSRQRHVVTDVNVQQRVNSMAAFTRLSGVFEE
jgi:hypothetical protein